jgi:hypothetical protein
MRSGILKFMIALAMTLSPFANVHASSPSSISNTSFSMEQFTAGLSKAVNQLNQQGVQVFDSAGNRIHLTDISSGQYQALKENQEFRVRTGSSVQGLSAKEFTVQLLPQHESSPSVQRILIKTTTQNFQKVQNRAVIGFDSNLSYEANQANMKSGFQRLSVAVDGDEPSRSNSYDSTNSNSQETYEMKRLKECSRITIFDIIGVIGAVAMFYGVFIEKSHNASVRFSGFGFFAIMASLVAGSNCRPSPL